MQDLARLWNDLVGDLGWVDLSALTILALFFLLGLVRGLVWQVGRVVALLGAYFASAWFAPGLAAYVFAGTEIAAVHAHVAHVLVFLVAFLLLSWGARTVHAAVRRSGLSGLDRLGGGLLGVGTGSAVVLGLLCLLLMFGQRLTVFGDVQASHTLQIGRVAVDVLGTWVPTPVQAVFEAKRAGPGPTRPLSVATPALDRWLETAR
ncbi:MAG: CvpA family protein [Planctomycetota bacterium]